jgi:hypothetical protein
MGSAWESFARMGPGVCAHALTRERIAHGVLCVAAGLVGRDALQRVDPLTLNPKP